MQYNGQISYDSQNYSYSGTLIIYAPSLASPIVLNNINIVFGGGEKDYSNYTTVALISIDVAPSGFITIEVADESIEALVSAQTVSIGNGEISIIS